MFIQTEETPNPLTLKFLPGRGVMEDGTVDFASAASTAGTPLATQLFALSGVNRVFFGKDFITVTKTQEANWDTMKPLLLECIVNYFATNAKVQVRLAGEAEDEVDSDAITKEIKELLDSRIRPAVAMDGGDITFEKFEEGVVHLHMRGACAGCPSAAQTLKSGVENMLRYYIPEVNEVVAVEDNT